MKDQTMDKIAVAVLGFVLGLATAFIATVNSPEPLEQTRTETVCYTDCPGHKNLNRQMERTGG